MKKTQAEELAPLNGSSNGHQVYSLPPVPVSVEQEEESLDLRQLWTIVRHRLRLVLAVAIGMTTAVGFWTFNQQPVYQGKFQLLIGSPSDDTQDEQLALLSLDSQEIDYETQIEVLSSPDVLQPILEQIAVKYPDTVYEDLITPKHSPLEIEQLDETKILNVSFEDEDPQKIQFVLEQLAQGYLRYSLEERQSEINQGIQFVKKQLPELQQRVDGLQAKLQSFRQQYNLLDPEQQASELSKQLFEIEARHFDTQVQLNEASSLYNTLQAQLGLQPNEAIAASFLSESPRYQNLLNQLQEVEIELANQSVIFRDNTPTIEALKDKRAKLLPLLRQEAQTVLGNNWPSIDSPSLASPSQLRLELNQKLIETASEIQILELRRQALAQAISRFNQHIKQMPVVARRYTDLQRELTIATESLNRFLTAEEELQLEAAQKALTWRIIAPPIEQEDPIYPQPLKMLSLGAIAGLLLGLGAAFLAERLDPVFHSSDELKENVKLPILGHIPVQKDLATVEQIVEIDPSQFQIGDTKISFAADSSEHKEKRYSSSPFLEAFRSLNTNIRLLGSDGRTNTLVISSSAPAEGKSTISVHLAKAAADMGQRVLIVDADLRRPQVYKRLGLEHNSPGLSNVLADGLDLEEVIQRTPQRDNLHVLTAGESAPDPPRLLSSKRMQQVMEQLQSRGIYDLVIYDTPPLLGFADGRLIASATNGVVLVVKMGKTDRNALRQTIDQLKMSHVSILGVVANGVSRHGHGSYYYYDHYYRYYSRR